MFKCLYFSLKKTSFNKNPIKNSCSETKQKNLTIFFQNLTITMKYGKKASCNKKPFIPKI
jgi:hypothetical protein